MVTQKHQFVQHPIFWNRVDIRIWWPPPAVITGESILHRLCFLSRPDDPTEISSRGSIDRQLGVYRHPDVQGFSGGAVALYQPEYGIYSLGIVLLEIGTW